MDHQKMLDFVNKQTKTALEHIQHFDSGGTVLAGPATGTNGGAAQNPNQGLIGSVGNALGLNNNFQAGAANIQQGTNTGQLNQAYTGSQGAIGAQQGLVQQFQPGTAQGLGAQAQLSQQLTNQANGVGPNPAQAALNQQTGQNIAQQAALMAGQRGAGANAGLLATQAAQQGAGIQQNAIGQGATLQAQQQLAAQQAQANLAAQQVAQGASGIQGLSNAQQNEQNILQGANTAGNNAAVSSQGNVNAVNAQTAAGNQGAAGKIIGGLASGASSAIGALFAEGGVVPPRIKESLPSHLHGVAMIYHPHYYAGGGLVTNGPESPNIGAPVNAWLNSGNQGGNQIQITQPMAADSSGDLSQQGQQTASAIGSSAGKGLGSLFSGPSGTQTIAGGPMDAGALESGVMAAWQGGYAAKGGKVDVKDPKEKAKVKGDSYSNDKVPAMLSEGEGVIDRETMQDPGPVGQMARAVMMHVQKRKKAK